MCTFPADKHLSTCVRARVAFILPLYLPIMVKYYMMDGLATHTPTHMSHSYDTLPHLRHALPT